MAVALWLMWLGAAQFTPTLETEGLSIDAPAGFSVGYKGNDDTINLVELVEKPETVDNWSRLISVVTIMGASEQTDLDSFFDDWRASYRQTCPGTDEKVSRGTVDEHRAIKVTLFCPSDPKTDRPESLTAIFVAGEVNILSAQLAVRRTMSPSDYDVARQIETSMKICDSRDTACRAGKARGYLAGR